MTYSDANNDGVLVVSDMKQINHYYPFGMNMEGNWNGASGSNKYQYNGKEWNDDFGLGLFDYGARFYDAAIGRWGAVDPLAEKYLRWTPYNYAMNRPTNVIDPNGMAATEIEGGVRFTGQNAINAFNYLKTRIGSSKKEGKQDVQGKLAENVRNEIQSGTASCGYEYGCYGAAYKRLSQAYSDILGYKMNINLLFDKKGTKVPEPVSKGGPIYNRWYPRPNSLFNILFSSNVEHPSFLTLPAPQRGQGAAGAIEYAGLGEVVKNINTDLKPGAVLQIWQSDDGWTNVLNGKLLPEDQEGHVAIFMGYTEKGDFNIVDQWGAHVFPKRNIEFGNIIFGANLYPDGEKPIINQFIKD